MKKAFTLLAILFSSSQCWSDECPNQTSNTVHAYCAVNLTETVLVWSEHDSTPTGNGNTSTIGLSYSKSNGSKQKIGPVTVSQALSSTTPIPIGPGSYVISADGSDHGADAISTKIYLQKLATYP